MHTLKGSRQKARHVDLGRQFVGCLALGQNLSPSSFEGSNVRPEWIRDVLDGHTFGFEVACTSNGANGFSI